MLNNDKQKYKTYLKQPDCWKFFFPPTLVANIVARISAKWASLNPIAPEKGEKYVWSFKLFKGNSSLST